MPIADRVVEHRRFRPQLDLESVSERERVGRGFGEEIDHAPARYEVGRVVEVGPDLLLALELLGIRSGGEVGFGIEVLGGHTEVAPGLSAPIVSMTSVGRVRRDRLVTSGGASVGDYDLVQKALAAEGLVVPRPGRGSRPEGRRCRLAPE